MVPQNHWFQYSTGHNWTDFGVGVPPSLGNLHMFFFRFSPANLSGACRGSALAGRESLRDSEDVSLTHRFTSPLFAYQPRGWDPKSWKGLYMFYHDF